MKTATNTRIGGLRIGGFYMYSGEICRCEVLNDCRALLKPIRKTQIEFTRADGTRKAYAAPAYRHGFNVSPNSELPAANPQPFVYLGAQRSEEGLFPAWHAFRLTEDVPGVGLDQTTVSEATLRAAGFDPQIPHR